jgi:hypothetical protein
MILVQLLYSERNSQTTSVVPEKWETNFQSRKKDNWKSYSPHLTSCRIYFREEAQELKDFKPTDNAKFLLLLCYKFRSEETFYLLPMNSDKTTFNNNDSNHTN